MTFWNQPVRETKGDEEERLRLAAEIVACSPAMPDPKAHLNWLEGLSLKSLRERLDAIQKEKLKRQNEDCLPHARMDLAAKI